MSWLIEAYLEEASKDKITYSNKFSDAKAIADSLSKNDMSHISTGKYENSSYIVYREVLLCNNDPAAFIDVYHIPSEMEKDEAICIVACSKDHRGKGFTKILVNRMKKKIDKSKIKKIYWETTKSNKASSALAKQAGFKPSENINKDDDNYVYEFK